MNLEECNETDNNCWLDNESDPHVVIGECHRREDCSQDRMQERKNARNDDRGTSSSQVSDLVFGFVVRNEAVQKSDDFNGYYDIERSNHQNENGGNYTNVDHNS